MILIPLAALMIALILTGLQRNYALRKNLLDIPNFRSSHSDPTPRGGGIAIVVAFYCGMVMMLLPQSQSITPLPTVLLSGLFIALIGYWDDHRHIPAGWRLLVHILTSAGALYLIKPLLLFDFTDVSINQGLFSYLLACIFLVWMLNLFNFMDGIDGLAGSEAVFISSAASFISLLCLSDPTEGQINFVYLLLIFACANLGFLLWNWPPAKIFMGDVGSGFIGFLLGVFALESASIHLLPLWSWLILSGIFLTDATITLMRRILRGKRWYVAHRSHAYQQAAGILGNHRRVTASTIAINILWLFPLAWSAAVYPKLGLILMLVAFTPLSLLAMKLNAGVSDD